MGLRSPALPYMGYNTERHSKPVLVLRLSNFARLATLKLQRGYLELYYKGSSVIDGDKLIKSYTFCVYNNQQYCRTIQIAMRNIC